jgi:hypothetical protein
MSLFRKNLPKEISVLAEQLISPRLNIPNKWVWWEKKNITLHDIEEIDIRILRDIIKLHNKNNTALTSKIIKLSKELQKLIANMLRQSDLPEDLQTEEAQRVHLLVKTLDNLIDRSVSLKRPGGSLLGPGNWHLYYYILELVENDLGLSEKFLRSFLVVYTPFTDPKFYSNLPITIKQPNVLKKYVINTVKFVRKPFRGDIDMRFVLFYRRSQPSNKPKPEAYWTWNYNIIVRGLNIEHSKEYKKSSIILVASLHVILSQDKYKHDIKDQSIHLINEKPFSQNLCLFKFKL